MNLSSFSSDSFDFGDLAPGDLMGDIPNNESLGPAQDVREVGGLCADDNSCESDKGLRQYVSSRGLFLVSEEIANGCEQGARENQGGSPRPPDICQTST